MKKNQLGDFIEYETLAETGDVERNLKLVRVIKNYISDDILNNYTKECESVFKLCSRLKTDFGKSAWQDLIKACDQLQPLRMR